MQKEIQIDVKFQMMILSKIKTVIRYVKVNAILLKNVNKLIYISKVQE